MLGVRPQTLSAWLSGPKTPSADQLLKMADSLDVSLDKLMGRVPSGADVLVELRSRHSSVVAAIDTLLPTTPKGSRSAGRSKSRMLDS